MAIPYQLSPLYQLIVNTRTRQQVPPEDEFANHLEEIERKIIAAFEAIRNQPHSEPEFREFINDHYLSLLDYQDRLFRIADPYHGLICTCITNLKAYMAHQYSNILETSPLSQQVQVKSILSLTERIKSIFKSTWSGNDAN